jgi:hypothetical protein
MLKEGIFSYILYKEYLLSKEEIIDGSGDQSGIICVWDLADY